MGDLYVLLVQLSASCKCSLAQPSPLNYVCHYSCSKTLLIPLYQDNCWKLFSLHNLLTIHIRCCNFVNESWMQFRQLVVYTSQLAPSAVLGR